MRGAKARGMRWDELVMNATAIAVEAGGISICPHETPIDNLDSEPAYELAHEKFKRGELGQFKDKTELDAALKDAFGNAGRECAACRKNAED